MNIQEALKTNLPFKRKDWKQFHNTLPVKSIIVGNYNTFTETTFAITKEDILAEDWEVLNKKVEVSKEQLLEVYKMGMNRQSDPPLAGDFFKQHVKDNTKLDLFLEELGF